MKPTRLRVIVALLVIGWLSVSPASASSITLLGDVNIGNPINGSAGMPLNAGNATFFTNLLADGSSVLIDPSSLLDSIATSQNAIDALYDSLLGVTSNFLAGPVTSAALSGVDLFVSVLPDAAYEAGELTALSSFLSAGGSILFLGDHSGVVTQNANINAALLALGSSLRLDNNFFDLGNQTTTNIAPHPFTAGVSSLGYIVTNTVSGGTPLVFRTGTSGQAIIATESFSSSSPVPEPTSMLLLGTGLIGAAVRRYRQRPSRG